MKLKDLRLSLSFFLFAGFLSVHFSATALDAYSLHQFPYESLSYKENRIFFITQQRSGTHWTWYILKHFSLRPSSHENRYHNFFHQVDNYTLPFIHHFHNVNSYLSKIQKYCFAPPDFKKDKILTIIRNPLDTLLRDNISFQDALETVLQRNNLSLFPNLIYLEKWPTSNRHVLYYEDLLDHPKEEIEKLLLFAEVSTNGLDEFMQNLDEHKKKTIADYDHFHRSFTKGKDRTLYQRKYTSEQLKTLVDLFKEIDPVIWDKYLKRYEL